MWVSKVPDERLNNESNALVEIEEEQARSHQREHRMRCRIVPA